MSITQLVIVHCNRQREGGLTIDIIKVCIPLSTGWVVDALYPCPWNHNKWRRLSRAVAQYQRAPAAAHALDDACTQKPTANLCGTNRYRACCLSCAHEGDHPHVALMSGRPCVSYSSHRRPHPLLLRLFAVCNGWVHSCYCGQFLRAVQNPLRPQSGVCPRRLASFDTYLHPTRATPPRGVRALPLPAVDDR